MYLATINRQLKFAVAGILLMPLHGLAKESEPMAVLHSTWVNTVPQIDGNNNDIAWRDAPVLTSHDNVADIDIQLQSVYTQDSIFMLVSFPDTTENREHKLMHWNKNKQRYMTGAEREDTFVFKWNMLRTEGDISLSANAPYKADIWYWKSMRTDHAGYADDKLQIYQFKKTKQSRLLISENGSYFYLTRKSDQGKPAYTPEFYLDKKSDIMPKYKFSMPQGSRADIKAKGLWRNGVWTIEFQRALDTTHVDDVQFDTRLPYYFGVSRHEIAGRKPNDKIEQPYFGSGEINQIIELNFVKK